MNETKTKESKKKSVTITNCSPIKKSLTSQEVCEIIDMCGKSGVLDFNYNELHITYQARKEECQDISLTQSPGPVTANTEMINEESLIQQDEMVAKDLELEELRIQNPFEYENMLCQNELEEGEP